MARFLVLVFFLGFLGFAFSLTSFNSLSTNNDRFDYTKVEENYNKRKNLINPHELGEGEEHPVPANTGVTPEILEKGKVVFTEKGECLTCHGDHGQGMKEKDAPRLAGQHAWYIELQLKNFKTKTRINEAMDPYIQKIDENDMKHVAAYLSQLPWAKD